jgi:opacity protein-like surface antigen
MKEIMMRLVKRYLVWTMVLFFGFLSAQAAGDVNLLFGTRDSSEAILEEAGVDDLSQFGVAFSYDYGGPVMFAVDLLVASRDSRQSVDAVYPTVYWTDLKSTELDVGVRKLFGKENKLKPYIGGGLAWMRLDVFQVLNGSLGEGGEFTDTIVDDAESVFGFWVNAGLFYTLGEHFNIGLDIRYSDAQVNVSPIDGGRGLDFETGGTQYNVLVGYHW